MVVNWANKTHIVPLNKIFAVAIVIAILFLRKIRERTDYMTISILLSKQIVSMFFMLLVGYLCVKLKLLTTEEAKPVSSIVLYVIVPCTIINAFQVDISREIVHSLVIGTVLATLGNFILILFSFLLRKPLKLSTVEQLTISYPNSGNLILPLVIAVLGQEWAIYATPFMVTQFCFLWTHAISSIRGEKEINFRKILTGVNMLAFYTGLVLFLLQIKLPEILATTVAGFSNCIAPLSMIVIGIAMGDANFKQIFSVPRHYFICFLRLIACPFIVLVLYKVTGIPNISEELANICLILLLAISSSQATTISQLAQNYDKDAKEAAMLNVMSVLFLIVTMPLNVIMYQNWVL